MSQLDDRAREIVAHTAGSGVERLFPLVDQLTGNEVDRRQALEALVRADRDLQLVLHQEDLRTAQPWRGSPEVAEVVLPVGEDIGLHIDLIPEPTPVLLTWLQPRAADAPEEVASLRDRLRAQPPQQPAVADLGPLAIAVRQCEVGVPFAGGRVIERASASDLVRGNASANIVESASNQLEQDVRALPEALLRRLDALREALRGWEPMAKIAWPLGTSAWESLVRGLPRGNDEPDEDLLRFLEPSTSSLSTRHVVLRGVRGRQLADYDPRRRLLATGPVLLSGLAGMVDLYTDDVDQPLSLALPKHVRGALREARKRYRAGAPEIAAELWWLWRCSFVTLASAIPEEPPDRWVDGLEIRVVSDGAEVARVPLRLEGDRLLAELGEAGHAGDRLFLAFEREATLDARHEFRWGDRLVALGLDSEAGDAFAASSELARADDWLSPSSQHSFRAAAAARACLAWDRAGGLERHTGRSRYYRDMAELEDSEIARTLFQRVSDPLSGVPLVVNLIAVRGSIEGAIKARVRASSDAHRLTADVIELGAELAAIDRLLLQSHISTSPRLV